MQFFVDDAEMSFHGVDADVQLVTNLLVEISVREQRENFLLAMSEALEDARLRFGLVKIIHDFAGDRHGHGRTAGVDLFNGADEFSIRAIFQEASAGARAKR